MPGIVARNLAFILSFFSGNGYERSIKYKENPNQKALIKLK